MGSFINWNTPYEIFYWIDVISLVGTVALLTYASISAIIYLTVQDLFVGTNGGDKVESFTGISGHKDRSGIIKVFKRFCISALLMAVLVTKTHIALLALLYEGIMQIMSVVG